jgi:hypothetical protein
MTNKKNVMHWGKLKLFKKKLQKIHSKFHLHVEVIFGEKDL